MEPQGIPPDGPTPQALLAQNETLQAQVASLQASLQQSQQLLSEHDAQALQATAAAASQVAAVEQQMHQLQAQIGLLQVRVRPSYTPSRFDATPEQIRNLPVWLRQVQDWLAVQGVTETYYQILQTATLFGTVPARWWQQLAPNAGDCPFGTFEEFRVALVTAFPSTHLEAEARFSLYGGVERQRPSENFQAFLARFLARCAQVPNLTREEKEYCFLFSLHPGLRGQLITTQQQRKALGQPPMTFAEMTALCSGLSVSRAITKLSHQGMGPGGGAPRQTGPHQGATPMELGALKRRTDARPTKPQPKSQLQTQAPQVPPKLSAADLAAYRKRGLCYRCGKKGHLWRECPNG